MPLFGISGLHISPCLVDGCATAAELNGAYALCIYQVLFLFFVPFIFVALLVLLPPSRNSDPGSHIISSLFSPLRATVRALHFYREKDSALASLVNSRRIVSTHAVTVHAIDKYTPNPSLFSRRHKTRRKRTGCLSHLVPSTLYDPSGRKCTGGRQSNMNNRTPFTFPSSPEWHIRSRRLCTLPCMIPDIV